jgi:hypothetical protein
VDEVRPAGAPAYWLSAQTPRDTPEAAATEEIGAFLSAHAR